VSIPLFELFFQAVNKGSSPFPWQSRLAEMVKTGGWPAEIGVPTGLGKTRCLDIAVWALAWQAAQGAAERTLPTRIWYVVNRRLLVDEAYRQGCRLAGLLQHPEKLRNPECEEGKPEVVPEGWPDVHVAAIEAVADALRTLRGVGRTGDLPLFVTRLRGAADLGKRPAHPAQPAIVFSTVPMFGSTWLFRSYAASPNMRPIDAAHAGIDSLVLLDEAHLARPLLALKQPLEECDIGDPSRVLPEARSRPVFVSLTATGGARDPFLLDEEDHRHPVVRKRINAPKPVHLRPAPVKVDGIPKRLAQALVDELSKQPRPAAAVVFANTPAAAREVYDELRSANGKRRSALNGAELMLLTGRMRGREADRARRLVLDREVGAPSGRSRSKLTRHLVVVATQTLEVGADLDFDVLVTESCGARALIQRLGRLNRLGEADNPVGVVVHPERCETWPVYAAEPAEVWRRLTDRAGEDATVDITPAAAAEIVGPLDDHPPRSPELLPAHLWEWVKTTVPPPGEAPVEVFFEGVDSDGPSVSLCWRATRFEHGARLIPSVHTDETVDVPLGEARAVLQDRFGGDGEQVSLTRLSRDRVTVETFEPRALRPGDVVVLHVSDGLYDEHGWAPGSKAEVLDVSLPHWPGLPLDVDSLRHWFEPSPALEEICLLAKRVAAGEDDLDLHDVGRQLRELAVQLAPRPELRSDPGKREPDCQEVRPDDGSRTSLWDEVRSTLLTTVDTSASPAILRRKRTGSSWRGSDMLAADEFDDLSSSVTSVLLEDHLRSVGALAEWLAKAVGVCDDLVEAVEAAGRYHDLGKAEERFQLWLSEGVTYPDLLAKSDTPRWRRPQARKEAGWPSGGRHEALSARLLRRWLDDNPEPGWDADLVLHLVLSHHGFGRPLVPPVTDTTAGDAEVEHPINGSRVRVSADLSVADWDQPSRFRRCCERYGYWGLALLEAIVRQADHLASARAAGSPQEVA